MRLLLALIVATVAGGCLRHSYRVELKPVGEKVERTLAWDVSGSGPMQRLPPDEVQRIGALYGADSATLPPGSSVTATFSKEMPADIGGASRYITYPSSLGTLRVYIERFRGNDDLLAQQERQLRAVDALVDILIAWADDRFQNEAGVDRLHAFLTARFRRDVKNVLLYARAPLEAGERDLETSEPDAANTALKAIMTGVGRAGLYIVERGYCTPEELPVLARVAEDDAEGDAAAMRFFRCQFALRMGREDVPRQFASIGSLAELSQALSSFAQSSPAVLKTLRAWSGNLQTESGDISPMLTELFQRAIGFPILRDHDVVAVKLACPAPPMATNGRWNEQSKDLEWSYSMETKPEDAAGEPPLCFAAWVEPNPDAQMLHFGRLVIAGKELAEYCFWRASLSEAEASQWEAALDTLRPSDELLDALRAFRIAGHAEDKGPPPGVALLIHALEGNGE